LAAAASPGVYAVSDWNATHDVPDDATNASGSGVASRSVRVRARNRNQVADLEHFDSEDMW
jgi:hypothetical protein